MNARRARDEWLCVCACVMWRPGRFVNVCTVCVCRFSRGKEREGDDEVYLVMGKKSRMVTKESIL